MRQQSEMTGDNYGGGMSRFAKVRTSFRFHDPGSRITLVEARRDPAKSPCLHEMARAPRGGLIHLDKKEKTAGQPLPLGHTLLRDSTGHGSPLCQEGVVPAC